MIFNEGKNDIEYPTPKTRQLRTDLGCPLPDDTEEVTTLLPSHTKYQNILLTLINDTLMIDLWNYSYRECVYLYDVHPGIS